MDSFRHLLGRVNRALFPPGLQPRFVVRLGIAGLKALRHPKAHPGGKRPILLLRLRARLKPCPFTNLQPENL